MSRAKDSRVSPGMQRARRAVDRADLVLLKALSKRFEVVEDIGRLKAAAGLPVLQKGRWEEVLSARLRTASELGLDPRFVTRVFRAIHRESIRTQRKCASRSNR